jgi:hypothetical protein
MYNGTEILNVNIGTGLKAKSFVKRNAKGYLCKENRVTNTQVRSAIMKVPFCMGEYIFEMKKIHKGAALRHLNKAKKKGYFCECFPYENHVEDIHEINTSASIRQGKPMESSYRRSVEELRSCGVTEPIHDPTDYSRMFGVFTRNQNDSSKLLRGYISFIRMKEIALYSQILGHAKHLKNGIMYLLNEYIVDSITKPDAPEYDNIKYLMYAGYDQGTSGLKMWKKRTLFKPYYLNAIDISQ